MQDLQEEKSQKKKKGFQRQVELPVALSVLVVAFALFSVASFGLINRQVDTVSYAAPDDGFTVLMRDSSSTEAYAGVAGMHEGGSSYFYVPYYYSNTDSDANRIFCVEKGVEVRSGAEYTSGSEVTDYGLIYLLQHSYPGHTDVVGGGAEDYVEIWATQAAIWLYQHEKHPGDTKYTLAATGLDSLDELENATTFRVMGGPDPSNPKSTVTGVYTKIRNLVDAAKRASTAGFQVYDFNISRADKMTKTTDGKYYQTSLISIVGDPSDALINYDIVNIKGVDGIKIVDESGKDLAPTGIAAGKKFYLRIPADKIADKTVHISYDINAHYKYDSATYYVSTGRQTMADLDDQVGLLQKGDGFNLVGSPDTGMNAAQTIYFIGLIVLLCGVGIVYANTKPVESKQ